MFGESCKTRSVLSEFIASVEHARALSLTVITFNLTVWRVWTGRYRGRCDVMTSCNRRLNRQRLSLDRQTVNKSRPTLNVVQLSAYVYTYMHIAQVYT